MDWRLRLDLAFRWPAPRFSSAERGTHADWSGVHQAFGDLCEVKLERSRRSHDTLPAQAHKLCSVN